jgi:hypothetical protein
LVLDRAKSTGGREPHTVEEYLQQARHNSELAADIRKNQTEYLDWAATSLFYSAVHYVNAYFAKFGISILGGI